MELAPGTTQASLTIARSEWAATYPDPLKSLWPTLKNLPDPYRKLRIGYVSADFREHSAAYGFGGMLAHFDRARFDVYAYYNSKIEQAMTRAIQENVTCWREVYDLNDEQLSALIRLDKIDILVDLSGHSGGNRLMMFALKPAPIQITAWGYASSTGMAAMDYFFTDHICVPESEQHYYTEKIIYLDCAISYFFQIKPPDIGPSPFEKNGHITFGAMNRLDKLTDEYFRTCAAVLHQVPDSQLLIKADTLERPEAQEKILKHFIGLKRERIEFAGLTTRAEHLATFNKIDICLDSFPQGGGMTICDGLLMGVPAIVLEGDIIPARVAASIMERTGLPGWITQTTDEYIVRAFAATISECVTLPGQRAVIRAAFLSTVADSKSYCKQVETKYRELWRKSCNSKRGKAK